MSAPSCSGRTFFVGCLSRFRGGGLSLAVGELAGMGTARPITELQLARLTAEMDQYTAKLKADGKTETDFLKDTKWRKLNGDARQIRARLRAISTVEANNVEVARLKAEREAAAD